MISSSLTDDFGLLRKIQSTHGLNL